MAEFTWEARARTGELRKGSMEADNEEAVNQRLRQQQLNPVKVARKRDFGSISFGSGVSMKDLVTFTRLFATMIDAGLPLVQCLEILGNQQPNKHFATVLKDIRGAVEGGSTFSEALRRHPKVFDELFVNLTHAGEVGGILDSILNRLSVYLEKRQKLVRQVRGAMVYPSIVVVIAGGVMTVLLTFVIPAFEGMFKEFGGGKEAMPKLTQLVMDFSHLFVSALPLANRVRASSARSARPIFTASRSGKRFDAQGDVAACR
ncbi:MAG: type II secretion system F family protein [Polyangiaceae bacterium]